MVLWQRSLKEGYVSVREDRVLAFHLTKNKNKITLRGGARRRVVWLTVHIIHTVRYDTVHTLLLCNTTVRTYHTYMNTSCLLSVNWRTVHRMIASHYCTG